MKKDILKPGFKFDWKYHVEERMLVPNLYFDSPYCQQMPPVLATGFLVAFIWGSKTGQFDDSFTPANKIFFDQTHQPTENK